MPSSRLHPFFRLCLCALGLLVVQALVVFLCTIPFLFDEVIHHPPLKGSPEAVQRYVEYLLRYALPIGVLAYPPSLLLIAKCRRSLDRASVKSLGLRPVRVVPDLARGVIGGTAAIGFLWALLWLTGSIEVRGWSPELLANGFGSIVPLFGFVLAFGAVGVFEEVLFRGYVLHNFTGWMGWRWGIALQAILFAVVHMGNVAAGTAEEKIAMLGAMPSIALVGFFFALSARKTGSLWFAIGFHGAWDFALGCIFSLPVSGINTFRLLDVQSSQRTWLSGGSFGAEGSFLLIPILLALIVFISLAPDHPQTLLDLQLSGNQPQVAPVVATSQALGLPQQASNIQAIETQSENEDEPRENRYRARFGSGEGFDSGMLRELRSLQEQRDNELAERERETKALEPEVGGSATVNTASVNTTEAELSPPVAAPPSSAPVSISTVPTIAEPAIDLSQEVAPSVTAPPRPTPPPTAHPKPAAPQTPPTPPEATPATPKPAKKPTPRW